MLYQSAMIASVAGFFARFWGRLSAAREIGYSRGCTSRPKAYNTTRV